MTNTITKSFAANLNDRADPAAAGYEEIVGSYAIVDTPRESRFDELVGLAASICDAPMSLINFVLHDIWRISAAPRSIS